MSILLPVYLLPAILFALLFLVVRKTTHSDWRNVMHPEVYSHLSQGVGVRTQMILAFAVLLVAILALSRPSVEKRNANVFNQSDGWIIVMDLSRSMTVDDVVPSRLSAMREIALEFAELTKAQPLALIGYAGDAFLLSPPAFDKRQYRSTVNLLDYGIIPTDGSNVARALSLAATVVSDSQMHEARIVLMTDSGGINGSSMQAASYLSRAGHTVNVVAFGTEGQTAETRLDLELTKKLAARGSGVLISSDVMGRADLSRLLPVSRSMSRQGLARTGMEVIRWNNLSHWLLLFAIPVVLLMFYRASGNYQ